MEPRDRRAEWRERIMRSFKMCSPRNTIITRGIRWVEHVAHMGEMRDAYNILAETLEIWGT
jgi:hypothetical protein